MIYFFCKTWPIGPTELREEKKNHFRLDLVQRFGACKAMPKLHNLKLYEEDSN